MKAHQEQKAPSKQSQQLHIFAKPDVTKTAFMCLVKNAPHSTFYVSEFPDGGNLFHRTAAMSRWPLNLASAPFCGTTTPTLFSRFS